MSHQTLLKYGLQWLAAISLGLISTAAACAVDKDQGMKRSQTSNTVNTRPTIIYIPLLDDVSLSKVSGSSREMDEEAAILQVLTPDHTGLTLQAQRSLYWYARTPVATRFIVALIGKDKTEQLLDVEAGSGKVAGIQQLDLGDYDISLQPEVTYQWSVTQVIDKGSQSTGVTASGVIERIEPGEGLSNRIKKSHGIELASVYASEGIWYDSLETLSSMIDKSPEDQGLVAIRASLLEQVGLHAATGN